MIACKLCLVSGESGVSFAKGNIFKTDEELFDHIEMVHDVGPVVREGETEEQATARFKAKNTRAGGPNCRCPRCLHKEADLAVILGMSSSGEPEEA